MSTKFVHFVDPELKENAPYRTFNAIPSVDLKTGSTVKFYPGTYEMGTINISNITLEGIGNPNEVILANLNLGATTSGTINIRNLTLKGSNAVAASDSASVTINNAATGTVKFRDVIFTNADFCVDNQSLATIYIEYSNANAVDRGLRSNAAANYVKFSHLNTSSNAYFTPANGTLKAVTVVASASGGSNTGNTTETVLALIS